MTERPYTDDDLRAEAANVLNTLVSRPSVQDIQRSLPETYVDSHRTEDGGATWDSLLNEAALGTAAGQIHALIDSAADLSQWSIDLGADGLEPTGHVLKVGSATKHVARIHFAFDPDLAEDVRTSLVEGLAQVIADSL